MAGPDRRHRILAWVVLVPAALIVGLGGLAKFLDAETWRTMFVDWGYPAWMSPVTGVLEVAGAVAMLVPRTRFWGAALVVAVMLGALVTRIVHGEWVEMIVPVVVLALAALTAWWSRPVQVRAWMDRR